MTNDAGAAGVRSCRFCGTELLHEQTGHDICKAKTCYDRMIEESGAALLARKREKHDQVAAEVFADAKTQIAQAEARLPPDAVTWMLPAQSEPPEPLPVERRDKFREHLMVCAEFAFREPEPAPSADLGARKKHETDEEAFVGAACATCRGRCCRDRGGDTALLLPNDLNRYRQRNPGLTKDEVIEAYLSYLPRTSTRGGCVYQASTGCALPREMRQDICNSYYCDALRWLRMEFDKTQAEAAILVAAHKGQTQRVATVDQGQWTVTADLTEGDT